MKFRTKTILGIALIEGILLSILCLSVLNQLQSSSAAELERRVGTAGRLLSASLRDAMIAYDLATMESVTADILGTGELAYVRVLDSSDRLMVAHGKVPAGPAVSDANLWSVDDGIYDRNLAIEVSGQAFGKIEFGIDVSPAHLLLEKTRNWTLGISAMEMLLVAFFSFILGTYLTRQLLLLRNASKLIAGGDLSLKLKVVGTDELAETATAFNHMVTQLRAAESARQEENRRQEEDTHRLQRQLAALKALNEIVAVASLEPEATLRHALRVGSQHLGLEYGIISRIDQGAYRIVVQTSPPGTLADGQVFPLGKTYCSSTLAQDDVLAIFDARTSGYGAHPCFQEFHLASYVGIAIKVAGQLFGTLNFSSPSGRPSVFEESDLEFVRLLARWTGAFLEQKETFEQLQRSENRLRQAEERYRSVVENIKEVVFQTDAQGNWSFLNHAWEEVTGFPVAASIGRLFLDYVHPDDRERNLALFKPLIERQKEYCRHAVRYLHQDGGYRWIEVFARLTLDGDNNSIGTSGTLTDITERHAAEEQLERIAHYDALTQLPNRILLADRMRLALAQAKRTSTLVGICYLDLDGFKAVNDEHGHAAGDRLLVEVANRLVRTLRAEDTVARLGGDEFVILLAGLKSMEQCEEILQRTIVAVAEPVCLESGVACVSASIGVAFYPETADDAEALLRQADHAMYEAKQAGKNRYQLFNAEHDRQLHSYRTRLKELERAMARDEFTLHYQPQVNLKTGSVVGMEALLRWQHPSLGLLQPGAFLLDLNNSELEAAIDRWVLQAALRQIDAWQSLGLALPVSVNISAAYLESADFVSQMKELLNGHPGAKGMLELEVLESAALADVDHVARIIHECRDLGVSFALDDFGTGFSSLTYFRRLPAETLKIDISFVQNMLDDPDDLAIVKGVVGLTQAFGRKAVAEGVTSISHGQALQSLGCEIAQGFGIARPMPAIDIPAWIGTWQETQGWEEAVEAVAGE